MENKKDSVITGNKLIAVFMGMGDQFIELDYKHHNGVSYHKKWDWIMPAVNKCHDECKVYSEGLKFFEGLTPFSTIKQYWLAVIAFLQWYNQQVKI